MTTTAQRSRPTVLAAGVGAAMLIVGAAQVVPGGPVVLFALAALAAVALAARLRFDNLVVAFIWSTSLVHLLKRAIFLTGPQPRFAYYAVVFFPTALLGVALARRPRRVVHPTSQAATTLLALFALVAALATVAGGGVPVFVRLAALNDRVVPIAGFMVGLALPVGSQGFARITKAIVLSAVATVPYGVLQLVTGPGPIERAWAFNTSQYSIQAQNIVDYVHRAPGSDWRAFSYHADPLTWGLFLLVALGVALANDRAPTAAKARLPRATVPVLLVGLFATFSRTPWLGALAMVGSYALLRWRSTRRPALLLAVMLGIFAAGISVGGYLYTKVFPRVNTQVSRSNLVEARYLNLGTFQARLGAWSELPKDVGRYPAIGAGYGRLELSSQRFGKVVEGDPGAHNLLVETVVALGAPGLVLLLAFVGALFAVGMRSPPHLVSSSRWLVALIFGLFVTGYANVGVFLNANFFVICGAVAAIGVSAHEGNTQGQPAQVASRRLAR
ncbi:MAG: O-antigen ligase family protein [Actinomycetota bacterium]|nr:O-antigen ligase family protein [Actinomycetota bacterium]